MLKQLSSTYKSLIGEYKSASETYQNRDAYETLFFDNSSQINAISYIQEKSKNTTIVMVNESHHLPKHRVLTTKILKNLSANGYKYLAVEALQNNDEERINIDGSVSYKSGIYMQEPVFNRLIKEAKKYGFQIISYDNMSKNRDAVSAKNIIKKTFDLDKNAKVLIHVGYDHINEKKNLAFHLKDLLDINPLTIDQTYLENTQIKVGLKSFPIAFIDQQKNAWSAKPSECDPAPAWARP